MSEKEIESVIRGWVAALEKGEADKAMSFIAEDAVWVTPEGTFKGKAEWKRYLTWMAQGVTDVKFRDVGIGIMIKGNKAVYEYILDAKYGDVKCEVPGICIYEFSDGKIQQHRTLLDRLSIAKQAAKGTVAKRMVNSMIKRMEKGLR